MSSVTPPGTPPPPLPPRRYPAVRGPAARGGPGGGYPSGIGYRSRAGSFRRRADRMRGFEIHSVSHDRRFRAAGSVSALVRYSLVARCGWPVGVAGLPATWSQVRMSHGLYDMPPHTRTITLTHRHSHDREIIRAVAWLWMTANGMHSTPRARHSTATTAHAPHRTHRPL